jgi:hypothetical protein
MEFGDSPPDPAPVTTMAWRLSHLIVGFAEMKGSHVGGPLTSVATYSYPGAAAEALVQLDDVHDQWIEGVRRLGEAGLARP